MDLDIIVMIGDPEMLMAIIANTAFVVKNVSDVSEQKSSTGFTHVRIEHIGQTIKSFHDISLFETDGDYGDPSLSLGGHG
jgi:hypothetical protein